MLALLSDDIHIQIYKLCHATAHCMLLVYSVKFLLQGNKHKLLEQCIYFKQLTVINVCTDRAKQKLLIVPFNELMCYLLRIKSQKESSRKSFIFLQKLSVDDRIYKSWLKVLCVYNRAMSRLDE